MTDLENKIICLSKEVETEVVQWRHHLHHYPELSFQEIKTTEFIEDKIRSFGKFEIFHPTPTGLVAILHGVTPGKVLAYRADIDALPITESSENSPCSKIPGVMHACGHDGHTAALLGIAAVLSHLKDSIAGEYRLLFQPAEECPPGGASAFLDSGVLDGVDQIFGAHFHPFLPVGTFAAAAGAQYAATYNFDITIRGMGAHAAFPYLGIDSVLVSASLIQTLHNIIPRMLETRQRSVFTVTKIDGGNSYNSMPEYVHFGGTMRTLDENAETTILKYIRGMSEYVCAMYGAECEIRLKKGYPILKNSLNETELVVKTLEDHFGSKNVLTSDAVLGGEDFASYLGCIPGCFFKIGSCKRKPDGTVYPTHQSRHEMDDHALRFAIEAGASILIRAAGDA